MSCEDNAEKIRDYKLEAKQFGIEVRPVDINKSGVEFQIVDNVIYAGVSNIKGIGVEPARRIVANQTYSSFRNFLDKFGVDANTLKPILGLRLFDDADPVTLFQYAEYYRNVLKKREARDKRSLESRDKIIEEIKVLAPGKEINPESFSAFLEDEALFLAEFGENDKIRKLMKKYQSNLEGLKKKQATDDTTDLSKFAGDGNIDQELKKIYKGEIDKAEEKYYGYVWSSYLEESPDYMGERTFNDFSRRMEEEGQKVFPVEVEVVKRPKEVRFKSGKGVYYSVAVRDANGYEENVTFWKEDYDRFREELEYWDEKTDRGNLLRIRLKHPDPGFRRFTFDGPLKHERGWKLPKNKADDARLMVMEKPDGRISN
jgi:DNA polymerase III alpha subunit